MTSVRRFYGFPWTSFRSGSDWLQGALLALLAIACGVAVWGVVSARREAADLAMRDTHLRRQADARAIEAALSSSRSDFLFLTQTPPLANLANALSSDDPAARRWRRLDAESTLLLFLTAHPEVSRLVVRSRLETPLLVAGRREGAPLLLSTSSDDAVEGAGDPFRRRFPIGKSEDPELVLQAWIDSTALLDRAVPAVSEQLMLKPSTAAEKAGDDSSDQAWVLVSAPGWNPSEIWTLGSKAQAASPPLSTVILAERYRSTFIVSLGLMVLSLPLGVIAFRQVRRAIALEEEKRQRDRIQELERQVWHNERLASLGRMAAGIAHEINNPLEGMTNYLGILERDLRSRPQDPIAPVALRLREGVDRVADITSQMLTFADPGKAPMEPVDLKDVLSRTFDFVRANPAFRHLTLNIRLTDDILLLSASRTMLGQLFLNLLLNAAQAQKDAGEIEVACRRAGSRAIVSVSDRGPGIPAESAGHIFEPFFSGRNSTGLGLSVCLGIVTLHQGNIEHRNREQGGTTMEVQLPLMPQSEEGGALVPLTAMETAT